jgi:ParB family chromosome partitioning protein
VPEEYQVEHRNPSEIIVKDRLRSDWGNLDELEDSIRRLGLLHPLTVEQDGLTLIAGERRLEVVKRLGWDQVEVHRLTKGEPLDAEYDENAIRKAFTLGEAEEYLRRKGRVSKKEKEVFARDTGYSLGTVRRINQIRKIAEDPGEAPSVREVATRELDGLQDKMDGAAPALSRVLTAKRVAKRDGEMAKINNLLPGQVMRRGTRPTQEWSPRLWKIIGDANTLTIAGVAVELSREEDPGVPDAELRSMLHELNVRMKEVDTLKQRLRTILEERKFTK